MLYLTLLQENQRPRHVPVRWTSFRIGRAPDNDLVIDQGDISRHHAIVDIDEGVVRVRDAGSRNGIMVEGSRVHEALLHEGDRFLVGSAMLVVGNALSHDAPSDVQGARAPSDEFDEDGSVALSGPLETARFDRTVSPAGLGREEPIDRLGAALCELTAVDRPRPVHDRILRAAMIFSGAESGCCVSPEGTVLAASSGGSMRAGDADLAAKAAIGPRVLRVPAGADASRWVVPLHDGRRPVATLFLAVPAAPRPLDRGERIGLRSLAHALGLLAGLEDLRAGLEESASRLRDQRDWLQRGADAARQDDGGMVAEDPAMLRILAQVDLVAGSGSAVLVRGETGTGKELVARRVHRRSPRRDKPFIAVNCSSIPATLIESTLFGIEKGAATGVESHKGVFELAHEGTLFLDEIGELPVEMQAKFLRALEERTVTPIGARGPRPADVRIVAATNRDLKTMSKDGRFRQDLYYRLRVVEVLLPPLRERPEDVLPLARHFLAEFARRDGKRIRGLSVGAADRLRSYRWPGNVRELRNVIERAVVLCLDEILDEDVLPSDLASGMNASSAETGPGLALLVGTWHESRNLLEKLYFANLVAECRGQVSEIARRSGIDRRNVYEKLNRHGLAARRTDN